MGEGEVVLNIVLAAKEMRDISDKAALDFLLSAVDYTLTGREPIQRAIDPLAFAAFWLAKALWDGRCEDDA